MRRSARDLFPWFALLCGPLLVLSLSFAVVAEDDTTDRDADAATANELADDETTGELLAGHSAHGEAFNEGPRQAAYLMPGTGKVHFPVTSDVPEVQKFVEQGIGQLHGFWYFEAERSFRQAAMLDPDCAIAYWGMALANVSNSKRAKGFIKKAVERREHASEREAMYIDARHAYLESTAKSKEKNKTYVAALEAIAERYPDWLEARAQVAYTYYKARKDLGKEYDDVNKYIEEILKEEPLHPVHHYRIHLWDSKDAARALTSSAKCGQAAPGIAHMWHMPGHIYSKLKRYEDAVWQQEASARVDHAHMMRDRVLPDQIHNFAHNNEWLCRNLRYIGRWRAAVDLAKNMTELPQHPRYNTLSKRGSAYYGRFRLFDTLSEFELWQQVVDLSAQNYLHASDVEKEQVKRLHRLGVAYVELGQPDKANELVAELRVRLGNAKIRAEQAVRNAKDAKAKKSERAKQNAAMRPIEQAVAEIEGRLALANKDYKKAQPLLKKAVADKLLQAKVQLLAGDTDGAIKAAEAVIKGKEKQVVPHAKYVELLWLAGKKDEAKKAMETLREFSSAIQFGSPVFERVTPIAVELGFEQDWRVPRETPMDVGDRPTLDSLGPFRWAPQTAADWTLKDHSGKPHSLADYRGSPVIVIFYLGAACLHCAEQLHEFAPMRDDFADAGISLIAISTDTQKDLKLSLDAYEAGMPFPLVSNHGLDIFKAYRAFDDFENLPLHGTFLIDGDGHVLWQDTGFEPFMDAKFLLAESQRLIAQRQPAVANLVIAKTEPLPPLSSFEPAPVSEWPRIDPAGIGGTMFLAGSEVGDNAVSKFVEAAGKDQAHLIVVNTNTVEEDSGLVARLRDQWNEMRGARFTELRVTSNEQAERFDWATELKPATGLWLIGNDRGHFEPLLQNSKFKSAASTWLRNDGVLAVAGPGVQLVSNVMFTEPQGEIVDHGGFALVPELLIDATAGSADKASRVESAVAQFPGYVGLEIEPTATLVVRQRWIEKLSDGDIRFHLGASDRREARTITLKSSLDKADLTTLRRAARNRADADYPPAEPKPAKVDSGTLIIIGGGGMPRGIEEEFVDLAGGPEAHIVVFPTAMPDPIPQRSGIAEAFKKLGAKSVTVMPARRLEEVDSEKNLAALKKATGLWFGGGRQWRFVDAYEGTKALDLMHDVLKRGGVVMGSSAGASIQAGFLARANPLGNREGHFEGYEQGLGFLPGVAVDQHFAQRNRFADLSLLVKTYPQILGIGIDESTALVVQGQTGRVTGRGRVHFYDRKAEPVDGKDYLSLKEDQRYDLVQRREITEQPVNDNDPRQAAVRAPVPQLASPGR